jgi:hypothetical protein
MVLDSMLHLEIVHSIDFIEKKCKRKLKTFYIGYNNIMSQIFYNILQILTKSTKLIPYSIHMDVKQIKETNTFVN